MQTFAPKTKEELAEMAIEKLNALTPDSGVKWSWAHTHDVDLGIHTTQYLLYISFSSENAENEAQQKLDAVLEKLPLKYRDLVQIKKSSMPLQLSAKTQHHYTAVIPLDKLIEAQKQFTQDMTSKEAIKKILLENQKSAVDFFKALDFFNGFDQKKHDGILSEIQEELIAAQKQASEELYNAMFKKWIKELDNLDFEPLPTLKLSEKQLEEQIKECQFSNEKKDKVRDIYYRYRAVSFIKNKFLDSQTEGVGLKTAVDNLHQAAKIFEENRKYLEKESHPFIRKMLYKTSLIFLNVGIGIITSVICAIDSKLTFGTWDYLKAMDRMGKKHTGKFKTEKALKIAGIPLCDHKKTPGNHS